MKQETIAYNSRIVQLKTNKARFPSLDTSTREARLRQDLTQDIIAVDGIYSPNLLNEMPIDELFNLYRTVHNDIEETVKA